MAVFFSLILCVFANLPCIISSYFRGGLLTWTAQNSNQIIVHHRLSYVYSHCSGGSRNDTLSCYSGCNNRATMVGFCTESNPTEDWVDAEGFTQFDITNRTSQVLYIGFTSLAWISLIEPPSAWSWSLRMAVDLTPRSDTGKINQSPVTSLASSIIIPRRCSNYQLNIPVADYDGDDVRCRLVSGTDECSSICGSISLVVSLNESACILEIASTEITGNYGLAIQIEDFKDTHSTTPLSSVPLQFVITVDSLRCVYLPYFSHPTPSEGFTLQADNNGTLQFSARVTSYYRVTKFKILSPLNFTKSPVRQPSAYSFEITMSWSVNQEDTFGSYVMCFSAEDELRQPSEFRCLTINITDIDDCQPEPCQNNGTCTDLVNDYRCDCVEGFNGTNCENITITNSTDGCSIVNSQAVCSPGYRCQQFDNYTVACVPVITTTPNPCMEHRTALNLTEMCGNYSDTGYCVESNSACLPSAENGLDWRCRCTYGYFTYNSSCVPVPSSLFEKMEMTLGINRKTDRFISLLQTVSNNSEHFFEFSNEVHEVDTNNSRCVVKTFSGFSCLVNSSGIEITVNTLLDPSLYHVIADVTLLIGQDEVEIKDTLSVLFEIQATRKNQTLILLDGTLKDTVVTKVDLDVNYSNPSLRGDVDFFKMDSTGLIQTNWTISLPSNLVSRLFTTFVYDEVFINIVVYKPLLRLSVNENQTGEVICQSDAHVNGAISQGEDYLVALPNGSIRVQKPFDYEMMKEYMFELHSQYDEQNFTTKITVDILDVNDNAPNFEKSNFSFYEIKSNFSAFVGIASAIDKDSVGKLNYNVTGLDGETRFSINTSTGAVFMKDTHTDGRAIVTVTDGMFQEQAFIYVEVIPIVIDSSKTELSDKCEVSENKKHGTSVCSVYRDGYNIYSSRTQNEFAVDPKTGNITTRAVLDREKKSSYNFPVIAKESEESCNLAIIEVTVLVQDENDQTPAFDRVLYNASVEENMPNGTQIKLKQLITVTDKDLNSTFSYSISGDTFRIDSKGEIFTVKVLDRETKAKYRLHLTVTDGIYSNVTELEIDVEDQNDNYPKFPNFQTFSVPENATTDTEIGQVNATDADEGRNAYLIYTETGSDLFEITPTGVLKVNRELDRESQNTDEFSVTACDQGEKNTLCNTTRVVVFITDVNEEPVFKYAKVPTFLTPENSNCIGISKLADFFEDEDLGNNSKLDFEVLSTYGGIFNVDSNGILSCPKLDYEMPTKVYELIIKATDRGTPPLSANGTIIIVVEDVNDNAPIPSNNTDFTIFFHSKECQDCSKLVALVTATDKDSGNNGTIVFDEAGGSAIEFLDIDRNTGLIQAYTNISQLSNKTYDYIVIISDQGTPRRSATSTLSFNVTVLTDTEFKIVKVFPHDTLTYNWTENVEIPSPFIDLRNLTNERTLTSVEFRLPNYNLGDFYLNGSQQQFLYVNKTTLSRKQAIDSTSSFDRETQNLYRFIIQAELPFYSMLVELTINITDVNDNAPKFQYTADRVAIMKEDAHNASILDVNFDAIDVDEGENAEIAYKISKESCNNFFQLYKNVTWSIFLNGQLDYENESMRHCFLTLVVYNPNNETLQSSIIINIEVQDVNDNLPTFSQSVYNISLNEKESGAQEEVLVNISGFKVTDPDSRQFGIEGVRMSFVRDPECPLMVKEPKAVKFVAMINQSMDLDYETKRMFRCTIRATDGGGNTTEAVININLLDINDNAPEADDVITTEIPRTTNVSDVIVSQINATDKDSGENGALRFEFLSTSDSDVYSYFLINSTNGEITLAKTLDTLLQLDTVELAIIVSDNGQPSLNTSVKVIINITDDNVRPFFAKNVYRKEVYENTALKGILLTVTANDTKKEKEVPCNCTYSITVNEDIIQSHTYSINEFGELNVMVEGYDRESQPFILLTVMAVDEEGKDTSTQINITVLDKNDNDPKFLEYFQFEVFQEARINTTIGKVTAVDIDEGVNAVTRYKIIQFNSSNFNEDVFAINEITGDLYSIGSLNIGALKDFTEFVTVEAIDNADGNRTNRATVTVIIKFNDTNQHPPNITYNARDIPRTVVIQENTPVLALSATDPDEGVDGEVVLSILEGNAFNMFHINGSGFLLIRKKIRLIGPHSINLTVLAMDRGVNPKSSSVTLALTLEGEEDITPKVDAMRQFQTYTWSLVGVTCFLILTTAIGLTAWCRLRVNAHNPQGGSSGAHKWADSYGLKHNVSYGYGLPQLNLGDSPDPRRNWSSTDGMDSTRVRYPQEEFDQRHSFREELFDREPPPLPKARETSGPFIPKADYE